jgi:alpha-mannosidase
MFAGLISAARVVIGQEQPVGPATLMDGALVTSFTAYQLRTFALKLAPASAHVDPVRSAPVMLQYDLTVAGNDGAPVTSGFDGKGHALPAEMLPSHLTFNGVEFQLGPKAVVAKGQTIALPGGDYNRIYMLAASAGGDQKAAFQVGSQAVTLDIQDWAGFIGQWDDRQWVAKDHDDYAEMTGIKPGYIKRADLAWYCSHQHNAKGENMPYAYSYLFAYAIDLPAGVKTITLPGNDNIRILAMSLAHENPAVTAVQPLYDVLPPAAR